MSRASITSARSCRDIRESYCIGLSVDGQCSSSMLRMNEAEGVRVVFRPRAEAIGIRVIGVVVKIMVPFWVPIIIWPLIFRVPKKGP